ncbi:diguanylate cyclase [Paraburkholderia sp. RL17-373-BIF-A]
MQRARGWYRDYESTSSSNRASVVGGETTDVLRKRPLNSRSVEGRQLGRIALIASLVPGAVGGVHDLHRVTASFGMAIVHDGETLSDTLARADAALYRAKQSGRDRISFEAVAMS